MVYSEICDLKVKKRAQRSSTGDGFIHNFSDSIRERRDTTSMFSGGKSLANSLLANDKDWILLLHCWTVFQELSSALWTKGFLLFQLQHQVIATSTPGWGRHQPESQSKVTALRQRCHAKETSLSDHPEGTQAVTLPPPETLTAGTKAHYSVWLQWTDRCPPWLPTHTTLTQSDQVFHSFIKPFIHSAVRPKQLEVGASKKGPQTNDPVGFYSLTVQAH